MMRWIMHATPRWTKFVLAVGALLVAAETRAVAGCGDHTFFSFQTFEPSSNSDRPRPPTSPGAFQTGRPTPCGQCPSNPLAPSDMPCRGPSCSGNNLPPGLPVTSTALKIHEQQLTMCLVVADLHHSQDRDWLFVNNSFQPVQRSDSIFHPPRHS
jgi:hypothetical protein